MSRQALRLYRPTYLNSSNKNQYKLSFKAPKVRVHRANNQSQIIQIILYQRGLTNSKITIYKTIFIFKKQSQKKKTFSEKSENIQRKRVRISRWLQ